jgi:prepilin-type processing-associated H-X9-DG protein
MPIRKWVQVGVLAALIALCAGLLLPARSKFRDAAARTACMNNLKQIALAVENFESNRRHYPPGTMPNPDLPPDRRLSWLFQIVPYLEKTDWFHRADPAAAWDADQNKPMTMAPVKVYICPRTGDQLSFVGSYLGVAGLEPDAAALPGNDPRVGMFGYDRVTKRDEVADGTSNTILVSESPAAGPWAQGGPSTVRGVDPATRPHVGPGRPFDGHPFEARWFGRDLTGANVAMADGSIRMIRETAAPEVLEAWATIAGKEEVPADW